LPAYSFPWHAVAVLTLLHRVVLLLRTSVFMCFVRAEAGRDYFCMYAVFLPVGLFVILVSVAVMLVE